MKYDKGEARGVATYKQLGVGGYYGKNEQPSEAQIRARSEGPYAGQYGMDYEPKRVSEYKRMLGDDGKYYKLGSLGKDLDTEEQIMARERREAIKEHDRVIREQNRLAAERSADILRRKGIAPPKPEQSRKGFLSHVGDRDPRILNANAPSKHEKMWAYANRFIPKPAQAPPKEIPEAPPRVLGVWKRPADEPHEFAEKKDNFRGEWPHEWGGAPEVRGPHENAPRKDRGRRGVRLQPDPIHDRGAKRDGAQDPPAEIARAELGVDVFSKAIISLSFPESLYPRQASFRPRFLLVVVSRAHILLRACPAAFDGMSSTLEISADGTEPDTGTRSVTSSGLGDTASDIRSENTVNCTETLEASESESASKPKDKVLVRNPGVRLCGRKVSKLFAVTTKTGLTYKKFQGVVHGSRPDATWGTVYSVKYADGDEQQLLYEELIPFLDEPAGGESAVPLEIVEASKIAKTDYMIYKHFAPERIGTRRTRYLIGVQNDSESPDVFYGVATDPETNNEHSFDVLFTTQFGAAAAHDLLV